MPRIHTARRRRRAAIAVAGALIVGLLPMSAVRAEEAAAVAARVTPAQPITKAYDVADPWYVAPGLKSLPPGTTVMLMPLVVQVSELDADAVFRPDWTATVSDRLRASIVDQVSRHGAAVSELDPSRLSGLEELLSLEASVGAMLYQGDRIPSKKDQLDYSYGDAMRPLQAASGARYALFVHVTDSYSTTGRKFAMVAGAMFGAATAAMTGVGIVPLVKLGNQWSHASLVDLETGQVLWFNGMRRGFGDLRDPKRDVGEGVESLLYSFPVVR